MSAPVASSAQLTIAGVEVMVTPWRSCQTPGCREQGRPLGNPRHFAGHLYTRRRGVLPVRIVTLYCKGCKTTYRANYSVTNAESPASRRIYNSGIPDVLEVSEHTYVEKELVQMFRMQMAFAHASGETVARMYNLGVSTDPDAHNLTGDLVWNAFYVHSLLLNCHRRGEQLDVPHRCHQADRFLDAINSRNDDMVGTGQPLWAHACDDCEKLYPPPESEGPNGRWKRVAACVMDGISIGHPRCNIERCTELLASPRDRFCPKHHEFNSRCAVKGCGRPLSGGMRTCDTPDHHAFEIGKRQRGQALYKLQNRLHGHKFPQGQGRALARMNLNVDEPPPPVANALATIKAYITRKWTHNEQLMVRPCGVIIARATFYESEGVDNVLRFVRATFPQWYPRALPNFLFFDNNCSLLRHLRAIGDTSLSAIGLPVDVFHAVTKHKESDGFCQMNCNPAGFPELLTADKIWLFNSSACEQVNAHFGDFGPIVREMSEPHHNFFLDEMIMVLNEYRVSVLRKRGKRPRLVPTEELSLEREPFHLPA
ncbi:hypothetical protein C8Q76DRAFT_608605 [Earliella scabrosa]|nr:hypothetical protein C8Q76DRAFT_608605 [Earliella scabrosa]